MDSSGEYEFLDNLRRSIINVVESLEEGNFSEEVEEAKWDAAAKLISAAYTLKMASMKLVTNGELNA